MKTFPNKGWHAHEKSPDTPRTNAAMDFTSPEKMYRVSMELEAENRVLKKILEEYVNIFGHTHTSTCDFVKSSRKRHGRIGACSCGMNDRREKAIAACAATKTAYPDDCIHCESCGELHPNNGSFHVCQKPCRDCDGVGIYGSTKCDKCNGTGIERNF